jgi:hypothetical protein
VRGCDALILIVYIGNWYGGAIDDMVDPINNNVETDRQKDDVWKPLHRNLNATV